MRYLFNCRRFFYMVSKLTKRPKKNNISDQPIGLYVFSQLGTVKEKLRVKDDGQAVAFQINNSSIQADMLCVIDAYGFETRILNLRVKNLESLPLLDNLLKYDKVASWVGEIQIEVKFFALEETMLTAKIKRDTDLYTKRDNIYSHSEPELINAIKEVVSVCSEIRGTSIQYVSNQTKITATLSPLDMLLKSLDERDSISLSWAEKSLIEQLEMLRRVGAFTAFSAIAQFFGGYQELALVEVENRQDVFSDDYYDDMRSLVFYSLTDKVGMSAAWLSEAIKLISNWHYSQGPSRSDNHLPLYATSHLEIRLRHKFDSNEILMINSELGRQLTYSTQIGFYHPDESHHFKGHWYTEVRNLGSHGINVFRKEPIIRTVKKWTGKKTDQIVSYKLILAEEEAAKNLPELVKIISLIIPPLQARHFTEMLKSVVVDELRFPFDI